MPGCNTQRIYLPDATVCWNPAQKLIKSGHLRPPGKVHHDLLSWEAPGAALPVPAGSISGSLIPSLSARIPAPSPLPSSGSFLGPNTSKAIPKITNRCVGCNSPSNMNPPLKVTEHLSTSLCRRRFRARETASSISGFIREQLSRQDLELFGRNGLDRVLIELQMRINHFGREPPYPLVERHVQDFARLEQLQKHQISIASVFHIMTSVEGNEADIVGI